MGSNNIISLVAESLENDRARVCFSFHGLSFRRFVRVWRMGKTIFAARSKTLEQVESMEERLVF